jgi:hypothetical protein
MDYFKVFRIADTFFFLNFWYSYLVISILLSTSIILYKSVGGGGYKLRYHSATEEKNEKPQP